MDRCCPFECGALSKKFLIVTADDFGLHSAVNESIEQAARAGILTTASLMVGAPAAREAVRLAHSLPSLRVGLHVVLADGLATLAPELIPGLADATGYMDGRMAWNGVRFFALPAVRRQLEAEIRAQFTAFVRTGLPLDHVNAHKHFHLHPTLLAMLLRIGRDYGLDAVRVPDEPLWFAVQGSGALGGVGNLLLKPWIAVMRQRLRAAGIFCNDSLFGVGASGAMNAAKLMNIVARLPDGVTEIYLHPAGETDAAIAPSMSRYRHTDERDALLDPQVREAIAAMQVGQGGYGDAMRAR